MGVRTVLRRQATDGTGSISGRLRERRFARFEREFDARPLSILDVGGTPEFWAARGWANRPGVHVTLLNLEPLEQTHANVVPVVGDAVELPWEDGAFDVAFSNSVIEHLFTFDRQIRMAAEIRRVAQSYWVQTPNYWFPVEPHFLMPGWQWLPERARVEILMRRDVGWRERSDRAHAQTLVDEVRLLRRRELTQLFPDADLVAERLCGLVKSWTAVRRP